VQTDKSTKAETLTSLAEVKRCQPMLCSPTFESSDMPTCEVRFVVMLARCPSSPMTHMPDSWNQNWVCCRVKFHLSTTKPLMLRKNTTTTTITLSFCFTSLFFRRSLRVRPGLQRSSKGNLWGFLVRNRFVQVICPSCHSSSVNALMEYANKRVWSNNKADCLYVCY